VFHLPYSKERSPITTVLVAGNVMLALLGLEIATSVIIVAVAFTPPPVVADESDMRSTW
jgi:hypothetical protein